MTTARSYAACITTEQALVAGGRHGFDSLNTVEVMNINAKQWTAVSPLPQKVTGITCGEHVTWAEG